MLEIHIVTMIAGVHGGDAKHFSAPQNCPGPKGSRAPPPAKPKTDKIMPAMPLYYKQQRWVLS